MQHNKIIYTDCDGVLLDWLRGFYDFAFSEGYPIVNRDGNDNIIDDRLGLSIEKVEELINKFNGTRNNTCPPLFDAIHYIKKLHEEHGYQFVVITAIGKAGDEGITMRVDHLHHLFGTALVGVYCTMSSEAKLPILENMKKRESNLGNENPIWIEDWPKAAEHGVVLGFDTWLMDHDYNSHAVLDEHYHTRVACWKEIYEKLT